jgi:hypothetical protein
MVALTPSNTASDSITTNLLTIGSRAVNKIIDSYTNPDDTALVSAKALASAVAVITEAINTGNAVDPGGSIVWFWNCSYL